MTRNNIYNELNGISEEPKTNTDAKQPEKQIHEPTEANNNEERYEKFPQAKEARHYHRFLTGQQGDMRIKYNCPTLAQIAYEMNAKFRVSRIDFNKSFHQLKIDLETQKATKFVCHKGLFMWT